MLIGLWTKPNIVAKTEKRDWNDMVLLWTSKNKGVKKKHHTKKEQMHH